MAVASPGLLAMPSWSVEAGQLLGTAGRPVWAPTDSAAGLVHSDARFAEYWLSAIIPAVDKKADSTITAIRRNAGPSWSQGRGGYRGGICRGARARSSLEREERKGVVLNASQTQQWDRV